MVPGLPASLPGAEPDGSIRTFRPPSEVHQGALSIAHHTRVTIRVPLRDWNCNGAGLRRWKQSYVESIWRESTATDIFV